MWVLFWPLNRVIKLTEINNALWENSQELGVYRVHNLTEQQSISRKGHGTIKSVQTAHTLLFFPDTAVTHILPVLQGIITRKATKTHLGPFFHLSNHYNSGTKMSLFCYTEPIGRRKSDSPARQKYLQTLETKINRIHEGFVCLLFITLNLSKNWIVVTLYYE